jgi:hypothetical protein
MSPPYLAPRLLFALAGLCVGCGTPVSYPFPEGNYTLALTHTAGRPAVRLPSDPIPEASYQPASGLKTLHLSFSEGGKQVKIMPDGVSGTLEKEKGALRVYRLSQGLFAGGRLTVEDTSAGLVSTYTVFGSGEPVLSSKRGTLVRE